MAFQPNAGQLALPKGSLILVTGATGYIATHIVTETLAAGYKVRGTVRSAAKAKEDEAYHNNANYNCVVVSNMLAPGSLDEALQGVHGVIHTSSPTDMNPDPSQVIPPLIAHIENLLEACAKVSSVKRFVYTSSATAATLPIPGRPGHLNKDTWNDEAVKSAWTPPHVPEKGYAVYGASKTEAERALWKFVAERNPRFAINTVLPDTTLGRVLNGKSGPTGVLVQDLYLKGYAASGFVPSQYMVNVVDVARIHITALLDTSVANERIFAFDEIFTWNGLIDIISHLRPSSAARLEAARPKDEVADVTTVDNELGGTLLRKWYGQDGDQGRGWCGLAVTVKENLEGVPEVDS